LWLVRCCANEILKSASVCSPRSSTQTDEVSRYIDEHRGRFGVEPICKTLGVSVSAYYQRRGGRRSARAVEDEWLLGRIRELHAANYHAYGYRQVWKALRRAGEEVSRCRVQRLMKSNEIVGAKRRGKP
jgi:putative transposase